MRGLNAGPDDLVTGASRGLGTEMLEMAAQRMTASP